MSISLEQAGRGRRQARAFLVGVRESAKLMSDGTGRIVAITYPSGVGDAVSLRCSAEAGFITGQVLHCDGGA